MQNGLFTKVAELGITGKLLRVIINSYTRLKCLIRINGQTSTSVDVKRGVRHGGFMSGFLYMMYVDEPISIHERSNASAKILTVNCGAPNFADDISFIALTPYNLKSLIDIVYRYSEKWKFSISVEKSCIMVYSNVQTRIELLLGIVYGDKYIEAATNNVHLGIRQLCYDRSRSSPARAQSNYINRTVQKDDYPICTLRMRVMEQYVENRYKHFQPIATFYCKTKVWHTHNIR